MALERKPPNSSARITRAVRIGAETTVAFRSAKVAAPSWTPSLAALTLAMCVAITSPAQDAIRLADDAPGPLPVEQSQQLFRVQDGFRIEIVASEPHLADPVAMAFDARGRMLVCEIHGYNLEGYLDIEQLNKSGELDRQVRRVPASDDAIQKAEENQYGTVKRLEDTDGDGRVDRSTVLADRLPPCYGIVAARDGAIVFCAPEIIYLGDADDDGIVETREVLFRGFGVGEMWTRINNPRWGLDNWIYGVSGMNSGGSIRSPHLPRAVELGATCFRLRSDGSAIESESGWTHGFGQALDNWGDRFLVTNQQHVLHVLPLPHRYLIRNPYYSAPDLTRNVSSYGHPARVYPSSLPDPWRRQRAADPEWVKFYGEMETTANGYFTAASGQAIYCGDTFPAEYQGNHFSVDNAQNLIHRCILRPEGISYVAERPVPDEQTEFLTSTEQWFRPVNLLTGPDGALYVVDMYRDIIEDYSAIPRHLQQVYIRSLIAGADRGRIWRIVPDKPTTMTPPIDLPKLDSAQLVGFLAHANGWWRETAQRLLVERQDCCVVGLLRAELAHASDATTRLHVLYTLEGLFNLSSDDVCQALRDPSPLVRVHGLRLSESFRDDEQVRAAVLGLLHDEQPRVRLQLALTLGNFSTVDAADALVHLARAAAGDEWLRAAVVSSATESAAPLVQSLLATDEQGPCDAELLKAFSAVIGARREPAAVVVVMNALCAESNNVNAATRRACLNGLLEGLQRGVPAPLNEPAIVPALETLLHADEADVRSLALQVAAQLQLFDLPEMRTIVAAARDVALDADMPVEDRQAAVATLAAAPREVLREAMFELVLPRQPVALQLAALRSATTVDDPELVRGLLEISGQLTPQTQVALLDLALSRQAYLPVLLDLLESGSLRTNVLDTARRERLLSHRAADVSERARQLFGPGSPAADRQPVLEAYLAALSRPRDPERGRAVFEKQCSKCHRLRTQGFSVGPDLLTAKTRADETLLSDILDPSSQITVGYNTYTVLTTNGRIFNGVLVSEAATSLTLRAEEAVDTVILRRDIDEVTMSSVSMMPEKLDQEVKPDELADLLAFLRKSWTQSAPAVQVLFDEEAGFPALLVEGEGTAALDSEERARGSVSLVVDPPQRFSATMPGWEFRIAEHPGPLEYRYLRFAWKQSAGDGAMLELASKGEWPAANDARLRFFSGNNTLPWQATRVSDEIPTEWTVVVRDLWADCGPITLTGIAPTAMGGRVYFDQIELLRSLDEADPSGIRPQDPPSDGN